jgi:hypothetical protein
MCPPHLLLLQQLLPPGGHVTAQLRLKLRSTRSSMRTHRLGLTCSSSMRSTLLFKLRCLLKQGLALVLECAGCCCTEAAFIREAHEGV